MEILTLIEMAQKGDKAARNAVIMNNTGLIYGIIKRFAGRGVEAEDLFQIGSIGLLKAVEKFDMNYNVQFSTYAVPMIIGEIKRFIRDDGMVKVSRTLKENAVKIKSLEQKILKETGREVTIEELAKMLNMSKEDAVMAMEADIEIESIYKSVYQKDGNEIYLADQIACSDMYNAECENGLYNPGNAGGGRNYAGAAEDMEKEKILNDILLKQLLSELCEEERNIISMRYFEEKTQTDIAKRLGISQVQVSRMEKKILEKMRKRLVSG